MGTKVYFNNSCNICRMEINHYKKIANTDLEWIDITNNEDAVKITSKTQKELLRRLHVIVDGEVVGGAKAFIIIWSKIPKYKFLSKIFSIKPLFFIFKKQETIKMKKQNLPTKICKVCNRPFAWRKKWKLNWDKVKYCSKKCASNN